MRFARMVPVLFDQRGKLNESRPESSALTQWPFPGNVHVAGRRLRRTRILSDTTNALHHLFRCPFERLA